MDKEVVTISNQSLQPMVRSRDIVNTGSIESITARSIAMVMSINMSMSTDTDTVMAVTMTTRQLNTYL